MIALRAPELVQRVEQFARATQQAEDQVVENAVQAYLAQIEREKIHAETEAFWQMYADLQKLYLGQYVAVHEQQMVDHDQDILRLEQRVVERFGDIAILIAPVTTSMKRDIQRTGFQLEADV